MLQPTLILDTTYNCNFACKFCSVAHKQKLQSMTSEQVIEYIDKYKPRAIEFFGGEPLLLPTSFYEDIISYIDKNALDIELLMTSNLIPFYKNPSKWKDILSRIDVCTSFQLDDTRCFKDGSAYTLEDFIKVFDLYKKTFDKSLVFLSVISKENLPAVDKLIALAKQLNTKVKLLRYIDSFLIENSFQFSKYFSLLIQLIVNQDNKYEISSNQLLKAMHGQTTSCPFFTCKDAFKCIAPNGQVSTCSWYHHSASQKKYNAKLEADIMLDAPVIANAKCCQCECFQFCNSCAVVRREIFALSKKDQEIHCDVMCKSYHEYCEFAASRY